ncbi:MAG: GNAT family N-acetyltransferase [Candidatus Saccharimonadales bacterium]|nr:GNAT family N-acetyltransferase [Candidatus Saccharimonadales bacterium]
MGQGTLETYHSIVKFMSDKVIPLIDENSWYLSIIGILPEYQGRGLGAGLVVNMLEKTDQLRIPTYVETFTSKNITFYNRLGYKTVDYFHEPTTGAKYWLMIRDNKNA